MQSVMPEEGQVSEGAKSYVRFCLFVLLMLTVCLFFFPILDGSGGRTLLFSLTFVPVIGVGYWLNRSKATAWRLGRPFVEIIVALVSWLFLTEETPANITREIWASSVCSLVWFFYWLAIAIKKLHAFDL